MGFQVGNKFGKGRPPGARQRLGEDFMAEMQAHFKRYGAEAIHQLYETDIATYMKIIASVLPKDLSIAVSPGPGSSPEELRKFMVTLDALADRVADNPELAQITLEHLPGEGNA